MDSIFAGRWYEIPIKNIWWVIWSITVLQCSTVSPTSLFKPFHDVIKKFTLQKSLLQLKDE